MNSIRLSIFSICFVLIFIAGIKAGAAIPGYEDEGVQFLSFIVETHHKAITTKGERNDQALWQEVFLDIKAAKGVTRVIHSNKRPVNFTQPDIVILLSGKEATQIDHTQKTVLIDSLQPSYQDGSSFLYAGRIHLGVLLQAALKDVPKSPVAHNQTIQLNAPHFQSEVEIKLDNESHVIAIEDGERSYHFQWSILDKTPFEYVNSLSAIYDFGFQRIEINERVLECKAYPDLSTQFFQYEWPSEYSVQDLRKPLPPPLTLSN